MWGKHAVKENCQNTRMSFNDVYVWRDLLKKCWKNVLGLGSKTFKSFNQTQDFQPHRKYGG